MTPKRVTVVTTQLLGYDLTGGVGTATTFLALGLARSGHQVDVLYVGEAQAAPESEWAALYADSSVVVRALPPTDANVEPGYFRRLRDVEHALRALSPDVVIAHEYSAPAYAALRLRTLGLAYADTLFVVFCHGTRLWVKEMNRNVRVSADVLALTELERASAELADVVVSPSAYLVGWMREQGWVLPARTRVIPLLTRSAATGETGPSPSEKGGSVERLTFFGRLEERKGVELFAAAINAMPQDLLRQVDVEFVGKPTKHWSLERVGSLFTDATRTALRDLTFHTGLDQHEALAHLSRPGTLAVMPSMAENSPNVVYECLERGIPFRASDVGGIAELVAPGDRERVLFQASAGSLTAALETALGDEAALRPARLAFDPEAARSAWNETVSGLVPPIAVKSPLPQVGDEWALVLRDGEAPEPGLVETLARAQAVSGADVVTCGVSLDGAERYFGGNPGGLGVLRNDYGTVALVRRRLLDDESTAWPVVGDESWPLLTRLSVGGAKIVSVPLPLVRRTSPLGDLTLEPSDALLVTEEVERALPAHARSLARLAAGLAADAQRR